LNLWGLPGQFSFPKASPAFFQEFVRFMAIKRAPGGQFEKGAGSPNPGGRTRSEIEFLRGVARRDPVAQRTITNALVSKLSEKVPGDTQGRSYAEAVASVMLREALRGNVNAAREITDRVEGRVVHDVDNEPPLPDDNDSVYDRLADMVQRFRAVSKKVQ
jgi:hypothetical protein